MANKRNETTEIPNDPDKKVRVKMLRFISGAYGAYLKDSVQELQIEMAQALIKEGAAEEL